MRVVIIVAMREGDRLIGAAGGLPWHVPADLAHFKKTTTGHAIIMGRKTFDSCGKPLPGRRNIVITRKSPRAPEAASMPSGTSLDFVESLSAALDLCRARGEEIAYIAGGAQIYAAALPVADEMIVTWIDAPEAKGDTFFPEWDTAEWRDEAFFGAETLRIRRYTRRCPPPTMPIQ